MEILRGGAAVLIFITYLLLWSCKRHRQIRRTGLDPEVIYQDPRPSQRYLATMLRLLTVFIVLLIIPLTLGVNHTPGFSYLFSISDKLATGLGLIVAYGGLFLCWLAQKTMGASWRVGIDRKHPGELVQTGIFALTRNPTYLGLFLVCLGVFILFPTFVILLWIVAFVILLELQVRLEEEDLLAHHGQAYRDYQARVKRYFPGLY